VCYEILPRILLPDTGCGGGRGCGCGRGCGYGRTLELHGLAEVKRNVKKRSLKKRPTGVYNKIKQKMVINN